MTGTTKPETKVIDSADLPERVAGAGGQKFLPGGFARHLRHWQTR